MSFLNNVRLVFSGRFQADVSTVNNDVRHYDNQNFEPSYQEFQQGSQMNGWWNPDGSGAFRLLDCRVTAVHYRDGDACDDPARDAAVGLFITGSNQRSSGKLVDLDPQWQMASAPWGLEVRLTDGRGVNRVGGRYRPHAFRDLWFGRVADPQVGGSRGAAAVFQSVLTDLDWFAQKGDSRFLHELYQAAEASAQLSIRLTTFGYETHRDQRQFTTGMVVGAIGPQLAEEPESFILGRRFAPANGSASWCNMSYCNGRVDEADGRLFLDLSNAIPLSTNTTDTLMDMGRNTLSVGILRDPATSEYTPTSPANYLPIGKIDGYADPGWLKRTGGVVALPLNADQLALLRDHPLAFASPTPLDNPSGVDGSHGPVALRETVDGWLAQAEPLVHRIDSPASSAVCFYTARYGKPSSATVQLSLLPPLRNQGISTDSSGNLERTDIPVIGAPAEALQFPARIETDGAGRHREALKAELHGRPRPYIEGQIYLIDFRLPGQATSSRSAFDYVSVHVREVFSAPADPQWSDIEPILTQYGNLYPVMSRHFIDLGQREAVEAHARILRQAFSLPIDDPNHMPVTRDLSSGKRDMILAYLDRVIAQQPLNQEAPLQTSARPAAQPAAAALEHSGDKIEAADAFLRSTGKSSQN